MGFPIRRSTDQRVFAPPRSLSQRITSFIACACQGIHQLPLRHLIVLIANTHHARSRRDRRISAIPKGLSHEATPCAGRHRMELAQKDQLLEIGSRARLGLPIIGKGLSIPCDKSRSSRTMKFEQIFSLRCQTEQAGSAKLAANSFSNDFPLNLYSTPKRDPADRDATILADCAFTTILRIACWWSRTGSNRRHPACKAGALPAELRPLIASRS